MKVTLYKPPHGRTEEVDVTSVHAEDAAWFEAHKAKLSMEDIGGMFAVYADVGLRDEEDEPVEAIELSRHRSAEDTFKALRTQCEELLKEQAA